MYLPTLLLLTLTFSLSYALTTPLSLNLNLPNLTSSSPQTALPPPTCLRLPSPPFPGLKPTVCEDAIVVICARLFARKPSQLPRSVWVWIDLGGCAMGYYLPDDATVPMPGECEVDIFGGIYRKCATDSKWNAGGINVGVVPGEGGAGTGLVEGEARFMMASQRITALGL